MFHFRRRRRMTLVENKQLLSGFAEMVMAQGEEAGEGLVPLEIADRYNWGAFLLTFVWGIFHQVWIAFIWIVLLVIPIIGPVLATCFAIWLGKVGNRYAWTSLRPQSVTDFEQSQKNWALAGFFLWGFIIGIIGFLIFVFSKYWITGKI